MHRAAVTTTLILSACSAALLAYTGSAVSAPVAPATLQVKGAPFEIDSAHSTVHYRIRHFGVSNFYGRINAPRGSFKLDGADLAGSSISIEMEIKNMDAGNDSRNRFLLSPDFFNAREFPTASFKSTAVRAAGEGAFEITGEFTMHGVTKTLTVRAEEYTEATLAKFGHRAGFECRFALKRSDFGMNLFVQEGTLGDEVVIIAAIEGVQS